MYYVHDKETGNKVEVSAFKLIWLRASLILSLIIYGTLIAALLSIAEYFVGQTYITSLMVLFCAYVIELYAWFTNKASPGKIVLAIFVLVLWKSVFVELLNSNYGTPSKTSRINEVMETVDLYNNMERLCRSKGNFCH